MIKWLEVFEKMMKYLVLVVGKNSYRHLQTLDKKPTDNELNGLADKFCLRPGTQLVVASIDKDKPLMKQHPVRVTRKSLG